MTWKSIDIMEAEEIQYSDDYIETGKKNIINKSRWSYTVEGVYKHLKTEKYYKLRWSEGATEYQEPDFYITEVVPKEVTVTVYEEVK
jgi:hypothetical protein